MDAYRLIVLAHIAAGTVALLTYWSAALARKGSPLHRRIGQTYLTAMIGVLISAIYLTVAFFLRGLPGIGTFLGYLVVITATACWQGWRAIRSKASMPGYFGRDFEFLAWLNLLSGLVVFAVGLKLSQTLLIGFSWVGIIGGAVMLWQRRRPPAGDKRWWLKEHYTAMLGCGVATHIAFLSLGLNRLLASLGLSMPTLLPWLAPLAVMLLARIWLDRKYGPKATKPRVRSEVMVS